MRSIKDMLISQKLKYTFAAFGALFVAGMEDLFNLYRNDPIRIQGRVADVLEPLYQYSDYVKLELERMHARWRKNAASICR